MTREEILKLDTEIVSKELFQEIFESEEVMNFQNCGVSGLKNNYNWFIITLTDGKEINLYAKDI